MFPRSKGVVLEIEDLLERADCGVRPASDDASLTVEGRSIGGELVIAEELIGFHKLWDLEILGSLAEAVLKACGETV